MNGRRKLIACAALACVLAMALCACMAPAQAHAASSKLKASSPSSYAIVYKLAGGTNPKSQVKTVKAKGTLKVSKVKTPKRRGYTFVGWYKDAARTKKATTVKGTKAIARRTLYAKWRVNTYAITYRPQGGALPEGAPTSYTVKGLEDLPVPERFGYTFMGWYSNRALTKPIDSIDAGTIGNKTLYARWQQRTLVAHRGYTADGSPDNSYAAIAEAGERGFDYVEIDVRFTSDGVPVLAHDPTFKAYTLKSDGEPMAIDMPISALTYRQLLAIRLINAATGRGGANILSFEEALRECREIGIAPLIHLKEDSESQVDSLVNYVSSYGMLDNVRWFSGKQRTINYLLELDDEAKIQYGSFAVTKSKVKFAKKLMKSGVDIIISAKRVGLTDDQVELCRDARVPLCITVLQDETDIPAYDHYASTFLLHALTISSARDVVLP